MSVTPFEEGGPPRLSSSEGSKVRIVWGVPNREGLKRGGTQSTDATCTGREGVVSLETSRSCRLSYVPNQGCTLQSKYNEGSNPPVADERGFGFVTTTGSTLVCPRVFLPSYSVISLGRSSRLTSGGEQRNKVGGDGWLSLVTSV